jgi:hypothetical protein
MITSGNKRKNTVVEATEERSLVPDKKSKQEKVDDFLKTFSQFVSPIYDTAICENPDRNSSDDGLEMEFERQTMSSFITENHLRRSTNNNLVPLQFSTLFKSSSSSNQKWSMNFAWGPPKKNPCFHVQLILNGVEVFHEFTVQQDTTYAETVCLVMHWNQTLQRPANVEDYDCLIWAGQLSLSCLEAFFTTKMTSKEVNSLIDKGFKSLPINTIVKSISLFDTEFINPVMYGTHIMKSTKIMKHYFAAIGFEYRKGHFDDWALILHQEPAEEK